MLHNVGIYEKGRYSSSFAGKLTKEYSLWAAMIQRCYDERFHIKNPTYAGSTVSENFKNFQFFAEWCNQQVGFGNKGWQLDKDILVKDNTLYHEDLCVFVPHVINSFFTSSGSRRGLYPVGVNFDKATGKYQAKISLDGRHKKIGNFVSVDEAFTAYSLAKQTQAKVLAERFIDCVDNRVYVALNTWEVVKDV